MIASADFNLPLTPSLCKEGEPIFIPSGGAQRHGWLLREFPSTKGWRRERFGLAQFETNPPQNLKVPRLLPFVQVIPMFLDGFQNFLQIQRKILGFDYQSLGFIVKEGAALPSGG